MEAPQVALPEADRVPPYDIREVEAQVTWPLRHQVLRVGHPFTTAQYPEDFAPGGLHLAVYVGGKVAGVVSAFVQAESGHSEHHVWRLRGMATAADLRGQGYGGRLIDRLLERVVGLGACRIWCHARVPASGFYLRYGFYVEGSAYDIAGIGPHYLMKKNLV